MRLRSWPFKISPSVRAVLLGFVLVGLVAFVGGLWFNPKRAWFSFLHNQFFFLSLAVGGLFFSALQYVSGARWSLAIRRLGEGLSAYLPFAALSVAALIFGARHLYGQSSRIQILRTFISCVLWIFFAHRIVGYSIAQDSDTDPRWSAKNRFWSPIFIVVFGLTFTMASFDLVMSLDHGWFSTIFGLYCFAGLFYQALAAICVLTVFLKRNGPLAEIITDDHLHDLGKLMFAFTIFWVYIGFSQFMLIWYANLPEETGYFIRRLNGYWFYVSVFLVVGKFALPFCLLLTRKAKRDDRRLLMVASFMLFAQWVDVLWMVQPLAFPDGPIFGAIELGVSLGFLGVFGLSVAWFLGRHNRPLS